MSVTLKEIASQTQLSIRSVSRILNLNEGEMFRPETRTRVLAAAKRLGYRPNSMARGMRSGMRSAIGLLMSTDAQRSVIPFGTLVGLERCLSRNNLQLIVGEVPDEDLSDDAYVPRLLREWSTDGMLIAYTQHIPPRVTSLLEQFRVPSIWMNAKLGRDCVYPDDFGAGRDLTRMLIGMGHRTIGMLSQTPNAHYSKADREAGHLAAMRDAGLEPRVSDEMPRGQDEKHLDLRHLLAVPDRPSAFVAGTAVEARALFIAALRLGIRVPEELSIVGVVDDGRELDMGGVQLTAMELPREQVGDNAANRIIEKVAAPDREFAPLHVPFHLVMNDTVASPVGS